MTSSKKLAAEKIILEQLKSISDPSLEQKTEATLAAYEIYCVQHELDKADVSAVYEAIEKQDDNIDVTAAKKFLAAATISGVDWDIRYLTEKMLPSVYKVCGVEKPLYQIAKDVFLAKEKIDTIRADEQEAKARIEAERRKMQSSL